jgi:prepilin-type N-terminal cleavage/methylation domain-containing protein
LNPRGVTLVELLAAISILVVVTALSLPAVQSRLAGARMEAAQGQIEAAVLATRAESVRAGKALVLVARAGVKGEVELVVMPLEGERTAGGASGEGRGEGVQRRGTVWCVLPGGVRVMEDPPVGSADETSPVAAPARGDAERAEADVQIAAFCPDGTAVAGAAYLSDGSVVLSISVNEWLGGAGFAAYVPPVEEADEKPAGEVGR